MTNFRSVVAAIFPFRVICLALLTCQISLGQTASGGKLTLKSGAVIDYSEARIDGEEVILKLSYGSMRLRVSAVTEKSLRRIPGRSTPPQAAVTPANTITPSVKPQDSPAPGPAATPPPLPTLRAGEKLADFKQAAPLSENPSPAEPEDSPLSRLSDAPSISEKPAVPSDLVSMQKAWKHLPKALPMMPQKLQGAQKFATKEVQFELTSKLCGNPNVKFLCRIPLDAGGKPLNSASDVVFYAPFINQKYLFGEDRWPRELAEVCGMTVFSMLIATDEANVENPQNCYYYQESGSYELVLSAWERIVKELNIPRKNLLVAGDSGGASMAQRFAIAHPGLVDAVVLMGGWRYKAIPEPNTIAWCVLHTRGDIVREGANTDLVAQGRSMGLNMLDAVTPIYASAKRDFLKQYTDQNFHHTPSDAAIDIGLQFLAAIRELRSTRINWKDASSWPLRAPAAFPWAVEKNEGTPSPFSEAVYFPSQDFAAVWLRNRYRQVEIPSAERGNQTALVCYPREDPRGIILYGGDDVVAEGGDDMDFLAMQGFIVVGKNAEENGDLKELLQWTASLKQWKSLPIFLVGFTDAGRDLLALLPETNPSRVKSAAAIDSLLLYPDEDRSPIKALPKTKQKVYVSSLDESSATREPFRSYLAEAKRAGANVSLITSPSGSSLTRFDLLEAIAGKLSP